LQRGVVLMNKIDLHIHSNHSADGELTVQEILDISKRHGLKTIAITDHNSVKGIEIAIHYGNQLNIEVIPGIEIDCLYHSVNLHLLGYFIDWKRTEFIDLEQNLYTQEMAAFPKMIRKLRAAGIVADEDEILKQAAGKIPCGELIGEVLLQKENAKENPRLRPYLKGGKRSDMPYLNFYRDFFAQGKVAHVPIQYLQLKEAIELVKNSNGIPIIAHPGDNLKNNMDMLDDIIREGVMGIEVFSNYHTPGQIEFFYKKAVEENLLITCGSDFHGKNKPGITIGACNCQFEVESLKKPKDKLSFV
jgi:predicted metal-dependent phosphoesterase TrpH